MLKQSYVTERVKIFLLALFSGDAFEFIFHLEDFAEIEFIAVHPYGIHQCPGT